MLRQSAWREIYTPANIVTAIRILLIPAFILLMLAPWASWMPDLPMADQIKPWLAAAFFVLLACTDSVDGYLARSRNEVTTLGKFLDPLADKILVAAALLSLIQLGSLPAWIALVILGREFLVSGLRMVAAAEGKVIAASKLGKVKTVFQIIAVVGFILKDSLAALWSENLLWFYLVNILAWCLMATALILTIASLIDYFFKNAGTFGFAETDQDSTLETNSGANLESLAAQVLTLARNQGLKLGTAESCTGGMVAAALTDVAGSSDVVLGGIVSYAQNVKQACLGVTDAVINGDGVVSEICVKQMAAGAAAALGADLVIATSGIAGPGGGSVEHPVGTVWFGLYSTVGSKAWLQKFMGSRAEVRVQATGAALGYLKEALTMHGEVNSS